MLVQAGAELGLVLVVVVLELVDAAAVLAVELQMVVREVGWVLLAAFGLVDLLALRALVEFPCAVVLA